MSLINIISIYLRAAGTDKQGVRVPRYIVDKELSQISIVMSAGVFSRITYFVIDAVRVPAQLHFVLVRVPGLEHALRRKN
jgi:hypothetical protein